MGLLALTAATSVSVVCIWHMRCSEQPRWVAQGRVLSAMMALGVAGGGPDGVTSQKCSFGMARLPEILGDRYRTDGADSPIRTASAYCLAYPQIQVEGLMASAHAQ